MPDDGKRNAGIYLALPFEEIDFDEITKIIIEEIIWIQTRSAEQIREIFDLPNDLDSSDIAAIQRSQRRRRMHAIRLAKSAAIDQAKHEALLRYLGMDQLQISNTISKHDGCSSKHDGCSSKHDGCSSSAAITSKRNATNNWIESGLIVNYLKVYLHDIPYVFHFSL